MIRGPSGSAYLETERSFRGRSGAGEGDGVLLGYLLNEAWPRSCALLAASPEADLTHDLDRLRTRASAARVRLRPMRPEPSKTIRGTSDAGLSAERTGRPSLALIA